jgi:hypothetical protein
MVRVGASLACRVSNGDSEDPAGVAAHHGVYFRFGDTGELVVPADVDLPRIVNGVRIGGVAQAADVQGQGHLPVRFCAGRRSRLAEGPPE